jgi:hypothetical protein
METLLVKTRTAEELQFVQSLLHRMKIKTELFETNEKKGRKRAFLDSFESRIEQVNKDLKGEIKLKNAFDLLNEL